MANTDNDVAEVLAALRQQDHEGWVRARSIVEGWGEELTAAHRELCLALAERMRADRSLGDYGVDRRHGLAEEAQMFDSIVFRFARKPGADVAAMLIDVCHRLAARGVDHPLRRTVYWMAQTHSIVDVLDLFRRGDHRAPQESWTVLLHEYVAWGNDLSADETVTRYLAMVKESDHRLGILPARLVEGELPPPSSTSEISDGIEHAPTSVPEQPSQPDIGRVFDDSVVLTRAWERRDLVAPYRSWLDQDMNARADGAVVRFDRPVGLGDVKAATLARLSIESMSGPTPPVLRRISVPRACQEIQIHAGQGGAYDGGLGHAYGRLAKWQCIAALAGVSDLRFLHSADMSPNTVVTVLQRAEACAWWRFHGTWWFWNADGWGGGFAVLRPEGRTLAVSAAADID
jgi:hypothetical protein